MADVRRLGSRYYYKPKPNVYSRTKEEAYYEALNESVRYQDNGKKVAVMHNWDWVSDFFTVVELQEEWNGIFGNEEQFIGVLTYESQDEWDGIFSIEE